jgi:hypothetical protein
MVVVEVGAIPRDDADSCGWCHAVWPEACRLCSPCRVCPRPCSSFRWPLVPVCSRCLRHASPMHILIITILSVGPKRNEY